MERQNKVIVVLIEGDIMVKGDTYHQVTGGEISVLSDGGLIKSKDAEMMEVTIEALQEGIATGNTIYNMEDMDQ